MATETDVKKNIKIWKATNSAKAGMMITDRSAYLIGSPGNFVVADRNGVTIMGKSISFGTTSENIRAGGLFVKMNDFVQMIPTTLVTPMPGQVPFPPLGLVSGLAKDMPFFFAMMA